MLNKIKKRSFFIAFFSIFFALSNFALADIEKPTGNFGADAVKYGNEENSNITGVMERIIKFILGFVGALSVLVIIIGGIFYIISGGESGKTEAAKGWILYAVVGLIVALLGWVIVNTVITGLNKTGTGGGNTNTGTGSGYTVPPANYVQPLPQ